MRCGLFNYTKWIFAERKYMENNACFFMEKM